MSLNRKDLKKLRTRMIHHSVGKHPVTGKSGCAVVTLTANELHELLEIADHYFDEAERR